MRFFIPLFNQPNQLKIMKQTLILLISVITFSSCQNGKSQNESVVTADITNFWEAYDKITSTNDSILQQKYLDSLYFKKGTLGLNGIIQARNYTTKDYLSSINNFPKFWNSIRSNTLKVDQVSAELVF